MIENYAVPSFPSQDVMELEEHEEQTHEELSAILGDDTSLVAGARRLLDRAEAADATIEHIKYLLENSRSYEALVKARRWAERD